MLSDRGFVPAASVPASSSAGSSAAAMAAAIGSRVAPVRAVASGSSVDISVTSPGSVSSVCARRSPFSDRAPTAAPMGGSGASGSMRGVLGAGTLMRVIEEAGWTALKGPSESRISSRGPLMPTAVCSSVTKASSRAPGAASACSCSFAPSDVSELLRAAMSMGWVDSSSLATGQAYQRAHKTPLVPLV